MNRQKEEAERQTAYGETDARLKLRQRENERQKNNEKNKN
jgi:hypothetical protein